MTLTCLNAVLSVFYVAPIDIPHCWTHACHTLESMTTGDKNYCSKLACGAQSQRAACKVVSAHWSRPMSINFCTCSVLIFLSRSPPMDLVGCFIGIPIKIIKIVSWRPLRQLAAVAGSCPNSLSRGKCLELVFTWYTWYSIFFMLEQHTSKKRQCFVQQFPHQFIFSEILKSSWILDFSTFWLLSTEMQRSSEMSNPPKRLQGARHRRHRTSVLVPWRPDSRDQKDKGYVIYKWIYRYHPLYTYLTEGIYIYMDK